MKSWHTIPTPVNLLAEEKVYTDQKTCPRWWEHFVFSSLAGRPAAFCTSGSVVSLSRWGSALRSEVFSEMILPSYVARGVWTISIWMWSLKKLIVRTSWKRWMREGKASSMRWKLFSAISQDVLSAVTLWPGVCSHRRDVSEMARARCS